MQGQESEVRLSRKECQRLEVLEEVRAGKRTQVSAAGTLGVTDRWIRVLLGRLEKRGAAGLAHGNRGRLSSKRLPAKERERIVKLYNGKYEDFNLTHFREMLGEREGMKAPCRELIRRILLSAGAWSRRRQAPRHRQRRPRREYEGELLQMDASIHRWLGEDQPPVALVGGIDDATGRVPAARFCPAETTEAYFQVLWEMAQKRGFPQAIYSDRDSVFVISRKGELEALYAQGKAPMTQFGRALKELGIRWIPAYSPQAKGRIERLWGTFQDRLLNEFRLEQIKTLGQANEYLSRKFLPRFNRHFTQPAAKPDVWYRPAPVRQELERILCWKETRTLARDHTFSLNREIWQVLPSSRFPALTGRTVEVVKTLRRQIQAWVGSIRLPLRPAPPSRLALSPPRVSRATAPTDYPVRGKLWL